MDLSFVFWAVSDLCGNARAVGGLYKGIWTVIGLCGKVWAVRRLCGNVGNGNHLQKACGNVGEVKSFCRNVGAVGDQCGYVGGGIYFPILQKNHSQVCAVSDFYGNLWNGIYLEENRGY